MAYQWKENPTMTVKMDVALNAAGNIKQSGEEAAGKKTISLGGIKSDATFEQANTVCNEIFGKIGGGTYDQASAQRVITGGVVEVETNPEP